MAASEAKRTAVARTQRGARYGAGTLVSRAGPNGDTWIAKWRDGGRQVQRGLGFVHSKKHPEGLTRAEAEVALGRLREQVAVARADERAAEAKRAAEEQRRPLAVVGDALIAAKRAAGRKPSTIEAYSYWLRIHIIDHFGPMPVGEITRDDVRGFAAALERKGLAPKSRANALGTLHSLVEFAIDEGWMIGENPVKRVAKPALADDRPRRPLPRDRGGRGAAARGARRPARPGRARDVPDRRDDRDAPGRAVRAALARRRLDALGASGCGATTSAASSARRSPSARLAASRWPSRVATELELLSRESPYRRDDDLVFAHPRPASQSTAPSCSSGSRPRCAARMFAPFASTTSGTPSAPVWPRRACRCASSRS